MNMLAFFGGEPVLCEQDIIRWPAASIGHYRALGAVIESRKYHRVNHSIVSSLEESLSAWIGDGIKCRAVSTGTAAIHISLQYFSKPDARVVTAALNWPGAVAPIYFSSMKPHFVDVNLNDACMSENEALQALDERKDTAVILNTHLYGNMSRSETLRSVAERQLNVPIVDDCAQAIEAARELACDPNLHSDAIPLSGNGSKHLGAGELGLVVTHDPKLIEFVDKMSLSSSSRDGHRIFSPYTFGHNYRPNVFSCSIAQNRIEGLSDQLARRRDNCFFLRNELKNLLGIRFIFDEIDPTNSFYCMPLRLIPEEIDLPVAAHVRDKIVQLLEAEGVPVGVWLRKPVWEHIAWNKEEYKVDNFPNTKLLLDTMFHITEIAPPNSFRTMKLYAEAFRKVWHALPKIRSWIVGHQKEPMIKDRQKQQDLEAFSSSA